MALDRTDLEQRLAALRRQLPELVKQFPDADEFYVAFAGLADAISDAAGPEDFDWAQQQIDDLLAVHRAPGANGNHHKDSRKMIERGTKVFSRNKLTMDEIRALAHPGDSAATVVANQHGTEWAIFANGSVLAVDGKVQTFDTHHDATDALLANDVETFTVQRKPPADFSRNP